MKVAVKAPPQERVEVGGALEGAAVKMFDFEVHNVTMDRAVALLTRGPRDDAPLRVSFVNADCVNIAARNDSYRGALASSDLVFADGVGMKLAGRALGVNLLDNVNGTDLFPLLLDALAQESKSIYLLGGRPGIADGVAAFASKHSPECRIVGVRHGYFQPSELDDVLADIARAAPDVLLVAFGAPHQELWLERHLAASGARVGIGVGGLFDFFSGRIPRAPRWMRWARLEWTFRLYQEPRRLWKRYLIGNPVFLARVIRARVRRRSRQPKSCS